MESPPAEYRRPLLHAAAGGKGRGRKDRGTERGGEGEDPTKFRNRWAPVPEINVSIHSLNIFFRRRVSCESAETPVTTVCDLSVGRNTVIVTAQWHGDVRMWTVTSDGFMKPCYSAAGRVFSSCLHIISIIVIYILFTTPVKRYR